jgi:hypothetical protein
MRAVTVSHLRLHDERETCLDRQISIAPRFQQTLCVKLMVNVANEFQKSGKLGKVLGDGDEAM